MTMSFHSISAHRLARTASLFVGLRGKSFMNRLSPSLMLAVIAATTAAGCSAEPKAVPASIAVAAQGTKAQGEPTMCDAYGNCDDGNGGSSGAPPSQPDPGGGGSIDTGLYGADCDLPCEDCNLRCNEELTDCFATCPTDNATARMTCRTTCARARELCLSACWNL